MSGLVKGDANCTTGLSKRIYDYLTADSRNGFVSPLTGNPQGMVRALCWAMAQGVVDEIVANAVVTVTVHTTDGALQKTPNPNNPNTDTLGPGADKTLSGTVT